MIMLHKSAKGFYSPLIFLRFMRKTFGKSKLEYKLSKNGWTRHSYLLEADNFKFTWSYYLIKVNSTTSNHPFLIHPKYNVEPQQSSGYEVYVKIFGKQESEVERIILEEAQK